MKDERFKWIEHKPHQVLQAEERPLLFQKLPGAEEMWDYEQNTCKPEEITSATSKVTVNWVCDKGHHFQAAPIRFRYKGRVHCVECQRLKATVYGKAHMMKFWDYERNIEDPAYVMAKSLDPVYWKCPNCGYEWQAVVASRKDDVCPCCDAGLAVWGGVNDFATVYPELGLDYVQELNPGVDAKRIGIGSHERLNWRCHVCGYEWTAPVYGRIRKNKPERYIAECPVCAGNKRVESYEKDLPQLAEIYSENNKIPLSEVRLHQKEKPVWKCPKHGGFKASFRQVYGALKNDKGNIGCPYCHGTKVRKEDSFAVRYPELAKEWADENDVSPYEVSVGSQKEILWQCAAGHKWYARIYTRIYGYEFCRKCQPLNKNQHYFAEVHPELKAWYSEKNEIPFEEFTTWDQTKAKWRCLAKQHEFEDSFLNITQKVKFDCPICEGRIIKPGVNDLQTLYPEAVAMYDTERNEVPVNQISPKNVLKKVFWKCEYGHSYSRSPAMQIKWKNVCPICSRHVLSVGDNDLKSQVPELEKLWDAEANGPMEGYFDARSKYYCFACDKGHRFSASVQQMIDNDYQCLICKRVKFSEEISLQNTNPELAAEWSPNNTRAANSVMETTKMDVLWRCPKCNGEYRYSIAERKVGDDSCPYCQGRKRLVGYNDLTVTDPELVKEWSPNNTTSPTEYRNTSGEYARWICPECHGEYSAMIRGRKAGDKACPYCRGERRLAGFNDLTATHPNLLKEWSPNNKLGPENYMKSSHDYALWICPNCHGEYSSEIKSREIGDNSCPYCRGWRTLKGFNDLATTHPRLAAEWSPGNEDSPECYKKTDIYRKLWICPECHQEYGAKIRDREEGVSACPYCRGLWVRKGVNDLTTTDPELAKEWSPNNSDTADLHQKISGDYALWICPRCKGEYSAKIQNRQVGDDACPYCNGLHVWKGFNDLITTHPDLAAEWSEKNEDSADKYYKSATAYVLWHCFECGGDYRAQIRDREVGDDACPYCRGKKALRGFNDLTTTNPELAAEWSSNNLLSPDCYLRMMSVDALWICPRCGGEYSERIRNREVGDNACPYCRGIRTLEGYNDFATLHPDLLSEWSVVENTLLGIRPNAVLDTNMFKVWWKCPDCNHKYYMSIKDRLMKQKRGFTACTYCNGRRIKEIHFF